MSTTQTGNTDTDIKNLFSNVKQILDVLKKAMPAGIITVYKGRVANIPTGWAFCNGKNGTPDMRGQFVYGAADDDDVNDTGGAAAHTLSTAEMPAHKHTLKVNSSSTAGWDGHLRSSGATTNWFGGMNDAGGGGAHNNLPPYLKKAWIMFLGMDNLLKKK